MRFTFGIVANAAKGTDNLVKVIASIDSLSIPTYEVVIVGDKKKLAPHVPGHCLIIDFDESKKSAWITKKKNLITKNAKFDNVVYLHDYVIFCKGWYDGWVKFGQKYSLCMNPILNKDGSRYRDWTMFPNPHRGGPSLIVQARKHAGFHKHACLLPYSETGLSKLQYFSGAYWVAKRKVMEEFKLDESLGWGQGEDVEWSYRVRTKYKFSINTHSKVQLLKQKNVTFHPIKEEHLKKVVAFMKKHGQYGG